MRLVALVPALLAVVAPLPSGAAAGDAGAASQPATRPASPPPAPATAPRATKPPPAERSGQPLAIDWRVDVPVTGVAGVGSLVLALTESKVGPKQCRWCEPDLNGFDQAGRKVRWPSHRGVADHLADVTAYVVGPGVAFSLVSVDALRAGGWKQAAADDLVILEAMALEAATVSGIKYAVARKRPYVRDYAAGTPTGGQDNLSFPSGHTSLAFAIATASGTVATLRRYRSAPYVWGFGMGVAAFTAYLRMAADKHYASDAIVGAAIGSFVGWLVPYLHHKLRRRY